MDDVHESRQERRLTLEEVFEPWELDGEARRDCISHRGQLLTMLARISVLTAGLSALFPPLCIAGLVFGLITSTLTCRDLDGMTRGDMDPRGYHATEKARSDSQGALVLSLVILCSCGLPLAVLMCLCGWSWSAL